MSGKNGKRNNIHTNVLIPSGMDETALCREVEKNFLTVCEKTWQVKGEQLSIPPSLDKNMLRWRTMALRYKSGDFRHTEAEFQSLKVIAQWTIDINCKLRNQPPKLLVWK